MLLGKNYRKGRKKFKKEKKIKKSRGTCDDKKLHELEENKNETKLRVFFKKKKELGQSKEAARDNGRCG